MITRSHNPMIRRGSAGAMFFVTLGVIIACGVAYDLHLKNSQTEKGAHTKYTTTAASYDYTLPSTAEWKPPTSPYQADPDAPVSTPVATADTSSNKVVPAVHTTIHRDRPAPRPRPEPRRRPDFHTQLTSTGYSPTQAVAFRAPVDPNAKKGCST